MRMVRMAISALPPPEESAMRMPKNFYVLVLACATAFSTTNGLAKPDPYWLRSWNEAQMSRPLVMQSQSRIAPADEPGTPLLIQGQVFEPNGRTPAAGVVVHA